MATKPITVNSAPSFLNHRIENPNDSYDNFLGFYHENCLDTIALLYLEERGCERYGLSLEQIQELGSEFLEQTMHPDDMIRCLGELHEFAQHGKDGESYTYFQRLIFPTTPEEDYQVYFTCVKINRKINRFQCITCPITQEDEFKQEVDALLEANDYIKSQSGLFESFSDREKEIIQLVCQGLTAKEVADKLFLSPHTVEKHKKNINKKGNFKSNAELIQFALNFNLI